MTNRSIESIKDGFLWDPPNNNGNPFRNFIFKMYLCYMKKRLEE